MRIVVAFGVVALTACASACASAGTVPGGEMPETVRVSGGGTGGMQINTAPSSPSNVVTVPVPIDLLWSALPFAYDSLKIVTNTVDSKTHLIGNNGFKVRRQLGKVALSKYLDCGLSQGSQGADSYEVQLSVLTQLTPAAAGSTTITTTVEGQGRPVTTAGEFARCTSKGVIEKTLATLAYKQMR